MQVLLVLPPQPCVFCKFVVPYFPRLERKRAWLCFVEIDRALIFFTLAKSRVVACFTNSCSMLSKRLIKYFKSLQLKKYRRQEQKFLVEGAKGVLEVLNSDMPVSHLLLTHYKWWSSLCRYSFCTCDAVSKLRLGCHLEGEMGLRTFFFAQQSGTPLAWLDNYCAVQTLCYGMTKD